MENTLGLIFFILYWVVFLFSIVLHEIAHGWVAFRLGDPTAYREGRLTLNPLKHIDPFMSIAMPLILFIGSGGAFVFGGAKPVPVNPYNYRNIKIGTIMDAAAGPLTNLLLAVFFALGLTLSRLAAGGEVTATAVFFSCCMMINVFLAAFNLLPIPPLDGSHVLEALLPRALAEAYGKLRHLGFTLLILLLVFPFTGGFIFTAIRTVVRLFLALMGISPDTPMNPMRLLNL